MSAIEDIQSLRRLIEWYDNRYLALSDEAKRRVDGGPFCRVPIGGGDEILEVFILGGKPNRRAVRHAIRWLETFLEDLPLEDALEQRCDGAASAVNTSRPADAPSEPGTHTCDYSRSKCDASGAFICLNDADPGCPDHA